MDTDLALTLGLLIGALSIPSVLSAFSDQRPPRVSAVMIMAAAGLIAYAVMANPGGYRIEDVPDVFFAVIGRYI